jgi:hypothetical protein
MDVDHTVDEDEESMASEAEAKKPGGKATPRAKSPRKETAASTRNGNVKRPVRKATTPPAPMTSSSIPTRTIVADDSHEEDEPEDQGGNEDGYQQPAVTRNRSPRKQAHVILDSEDEASVANDHTGDEDDFLVLKAGTRTKGKARAKRLGLNRLIS